MESNSSKPRIAWGSRASSRKAPPSALPMRRRTHRKEKLLGSVAVEERLSFGESVAQFHGANNDRARTRDDRAPSRARTNRCLACRNAFEGGKNDQQGHAALSQ